jgi:outer membrane protein assembly factor BamB
MANWGRIMKTLHALLLGILFGVAPACGVLAVSPQFHAGPDHAGVFPGKGPDGFFEQLWRFDAGHAVVSSPVVADGVLYAGAKNGSFYALDAHSGALKWKFSADAPITSSAAIAGGICYFTTSANTVYALNTDGSLIWKRSTGPDLPFDALAGFHTSQDWDYWTSSPLVLDGRVTVGSGDGKIYSLDAKSGDVVWSFATTGRERSSPASDGKAIFAGSFDGPMVALDPRNGKLRWSFHTLGTPVFPAGSIQSSPAVKDGLVYFGARDFNLYALDARTGKEVWHQSVKNSWVPSTPAVSDGRVYTGSADGRALFAFEAKTGKLLWTTPLDNLVFSSPVVAGDAVYIATLGGTVFGVTSASGRVVSYTLTQDRVLSTPWIENAILYFGDNDGYIYAFRSGAKNFPGG